MQKGRSLRRCRVVSSRCIGHRERVALPWPGVVEHVDVVVRSRLGLVRAVRAGNDQPDRVGLLTVGHVCACVPEPGVIRQDTESSQEAVCEPDECAYPEGGVIFPEENRDVAVAIS